MTLQWIPACAGMTLQWIPACAGDDAGNGFPSETTLMVGSIATNLPGRMAKSLPPCKEVARGLVRAQIRP